ncbi:MAG: YihY/virulence factor BrkB family protein [Bacteroidota bacterium]|nr:YihY/virulence factor BrkB family protein [Bacteroidota bacterium]
MELQDLPSYVTKILHWKFISKLLRKSKRIVLPGFDGIPLYDVFGFFIKGLYQGYITTRAAAISFNFFLALFPTIIVLFTIIPIIPLANFQGALLGIIRDLIPHAAYEPVRETVEDIVIRQHSGLMSLGFILALYFSTSGFSSLMDAFNNTVHTIETRSWIKQRLVSLLLVLIFTLLIIIAIGLISFGNILLSLILPQTMESTNFYSILLLILKWSIILEALFLAISFIYYLAPARRGHFKFISAGGSLATILFIVTTLGFDFYVNNFSRYNVLYGSIGTLMIVLMWIYFNAFSLLAGFELNASILNARKKKEQLISQKSSGTSGSVPPGK